MALQQLLNYIKQRLAQGATKAEIKESLLGSGWRQPDIDEGFKTFESLAPSVSVPPPSQPGQPFSAIPVQEPGRKSKLLLALPFAVALLPIGGAAFAYYYFNTPEVVIKRMITAEEKVESVAFEGKINFAVSGNQNVPLGIFAGAEKMTMNFSGVADSRDENNPKGLFRFDITAAGSDLIALEMKQIGKIFYLKVSETPFLEFYGLSSVADQWIKIDAKALENQPGFESLGENLDNELTPEEIEKIEKIFRDSKFIKVVEKLPAEKIEGESNHHYKFAIDKDAFKKLLADIMPIVEKKPLSAEEIKELDDGFGAIKAIEGEVWINKKDLLLSKIIFNMKIEEQDSSLGDVGLEANLEMSFRNYNKPAQIEPPSSAKSFEEIVAPLLEELEEQESKYRDLQRMGDMRQFLTAQEIYYADNGKYLTDTAQNSTPAIMSLGDDLLPSLTDPQEDVNHYKWLDNTKCSLFGRVYCAYATLENKGNCSNVRYFAVSEKGPKEICDKAPSNGCRCF